MKQVKLDITHKLK